LTWETKIRTFDTRGEARRFVLFVAVGGTAAAANWLSRFPLEHFMSFSPAIALAYLVGMVIAFMLFSRYVFPASSRPLAEQIKFFVLVNVAGIVQVWVMSVALVYYVFPTIGFKGPLAEPVGHGIAIGVPAISSYIGHKFLTFKDS
jgi:putative flippase GtrA